MVSSGSKAVVLGAVVLAAHWPWGATAQFELPKADAAGTAGATAGTASNTAAAFGGLGAPPTRLSYQYAYGMESPITYRRNNDLDSRVRDDLLLFKTKVFGSFVYRPTDWLTTTLEMKLGREYPIHEEQRVPLPNSDTRLPPHRPPTLLVEQALLTVRQVIAPFEINIGRRNYEDDRHWVFDGSMDVASVSYRHATVRAEAMVARDVLWSLDALRHAAKQRVETAMVYADYRGIDNHVLAAYLIKRNHLRGQEGQPLLLGLRGSGKPSDAINWWAEAALLRGSDEQGRRFRAQAVDIGGTYRFADLPFDPNITLAYAHGSGDNTPDDGTNSTFRQTGLQTNEAKYIGLSKFKAYGEMLDPELSNLRVMTLGLGARATPGISIDMVYHRYQLDADASEIRNWALTAQMNTLAGQHSKDVGQALDLVVGMRGLFDIRRLGLDLRVGLFLPGQAFRTSDGMLANTASRRADRGASLVAKFRY